MPSLSKPAVSLSPLSRRVQVLKMQKSIVISAPRLFPKNPSGFTPQWCQIVYVARTAVIVLQSLIAK